MSLERSLRIAIAIPKEDAETTFSTYYKAFAHMGAELVAVDKDDDPKLFDGLLLPGGGDVNPKLYGQENTQSEGINDSLDDLQFSVLDNFYKADKPILGICRGHQVINVYLGGNLIQHLDTSKNHLPKPKQGDLVHLVVADKGSIHHRLYGKEFSVNSYHHQGIDSLGQGLKATLYSKDDNVVEACEYPEKKLYTVQYHPERICFERARPDAVDGQKIIGYFLDVCQASRK
ncbi:MAG: gamma-glutamyl-gamma-aminobutyrate hydrolase family protein [Christensenellales bacterium]|jgi:putative glutamine amidotransferase|nr:gamma-glutamyl-gamma-aminobutyrate hydrolase family protein [Clostridiales bacterium]